MAEQVKCFLVSKDQDTVRSEITRRPLADLPPGDVLIRVQYSSLNYKDALAATGHPGVTRKFPHVPGIDAAGVVLESQDPQFPPGTEVVVTGRELGVERWGGWAEAIRVPAEWVMKRPHGLSLKETMILGTAGFTAAQCLLAVRSHGIRPADGDIVVSGATGGVGIVAVKLFASQGYRVVAVSGKQDRHDRLKQHGAAEVVDRQSFLDSSKRPLLSAKYAGAVDTVGGEMLTTIIRSLSQRGCVAACGVVGGADLPLTVYPFILRGVTLAGIDSAWCPDDRRRVIWELLSTTWKIKDLDSLAQTVELDDVGDAVNEILAGQIFGRTVVHVAD
jgi:acrylyl-CoA reductase (NADPH)